MTSYTAIADSTASQDKATTQALVRALRDNPVAMAEGSSGAPSINPKAVASFPFHVLTAAAEKVYNTASAAAQVEFTNKLIDKGNFYDNSSSPYCRFTPLSVGFYEIEVSLVVLRAAATDSEVYLRKNGNIITKWTVQAGTGNMHRALSTIVQMNGSTDYVDVAVKGTSTVTLPVDGIGQSYIKGKKIAE